MNLQEYRQDQARSFYSHLRQATNPVFFYWQDPDTPMPQIGGEPRGVSGYPFQSDNAVQLAMAAKGQGFQSPYWMTYDQAKACGGAIRRGEIGTKILSWKGKEGEYEPIVMTVFNGDQVQGMELPRQQGLTEEQQATRKAGLDALIPERKRTPTPEQYNVRLRQVLLEQFPAEGGAQEQAKATLRREMATLTAQARLGLPRAVDPSLATTLKPYVDAKPNWREVEQAIKDADKALKDLGIQAMTFTKIAHKEVKADVVPAVEPKAKQKTKVKEKAQAKSKENDIPF